MVDRNDRSELPGCDDLIARGLYHHVRGGPDHLDAIPAPPNEPIGSVFGVEDTESMSPVVDSGAPDFAAAPFASERPSYGHIEPDSASTAQHAQRALPPHLSGAPRAGLPQHPHMTHLDDTLCQQDIGLQSCDSGIFSGSIHSGITISSSRDDTNFVPSFPQPGNIPSTTSSGTERLTEGLQNLHIRREYLPSDVTIDRNRTIGSHPNQLPNQYLHPAPNIANPSPENLREITERFQRNLKYIEQDSDLDTNLHQLIYADKDEVVVNLLDDLISYQFLDVTNKRKQTILHIAVMMNKPKLCRAIMVHGAAVDSRDDQGNTALHFACEKGYFQCVQVLTKHLEYNEVKDVSYQVPFRCIPQSMELRNYEGFTCVHLAAMNDHFDVVHYLVHDCHADVNAQEGKRGMTPLMLCADLRKAQMLMYLIQQCRADIHARTYDRRNATELALGRGYTDIANLLKAVGGEADRHADEEEDWIDEDFNDFTVNGQAVAMDTANNGMVNSMNLH